jgi:hypothetical protein
MAELLGQACDHAFHYPDAPALRRHGPRGYADYSFYKPWLRDDFAFRCLYCLWRERWQADGQHSFSVEHLQPQGAEPEKSLDYDNLVYACTLCNSTRRDVPLPFHPAHQPLGLHLLALPDGAMRALTPLGAELLELCRLNRPLLVAARRRILNLIAFLRNAKEPEPFEALRELLAFPTDLPNLAVLRPPDGNDRPEGVTDSCFERKRRGELPDVY